MCAARLHGCRPAVPKPPPNRRPHTSCPSCLCFLLPSDRRVQVAHGHEHVERVRRPLLCAAPHRAVPASHGRLAQVRAAGAAVGSLCCALRMLPACTCSVLPAVAPTHQPPASPVHSTPTLQTASRASTCGGPKFCAPCACSAWACCRASCARCTFPRARAASCRRVRVPLPRLPPP